MMIMKYLMIVNVFPEAELYRHSQVNHRERTLEANPHLNALKNCLLT